MKSERGDFNSCGKWFSRVLPLMLWWLLVWFSNFYSGCPWTYFVSQMKNLDQWLTKRYLLSRKLLISCQGFKVVIKIRSELQHVVHYWVTQQLRGPNFTQFWSPLLSSGQTWTLYILLSTLCHVTPINFLLTPSLSSYPRCFWLTLYAIDTVSIR